MSLIKTPWTQQPQGPVEIDWSNPITRGLRAAVSGTGAYDFVTKKSLPYAGAYSVTTQQGIAHKCNAVAITTPQYIELPFELSGTLSVHAVVSRDATVGTDSSKVAELVTNRTNFAATFWELNLGNGFGAVGDYGKPRFSTNAVGIGSIYVNGALTTGNNPSDAILNNGQFYNITAVASSGATSSGSGKTWLLGARTAAANYYSLNGRAPLILLFDRAISESEVRSISQNPWQIFKPISRRIFVPVAAGGGDVTGTFSATEVAETLSASGGIIVGGASSITEAVETASASGSVAIGATSSITETAETLSASGTVDSGVVGTASISEAAETASASGAVAVGGTASITQAAQTLTAAGSIQITGAGNLIELAETLTASGIVLGGITGSANLTQAAQTLSAFATASFPTIGRPTSDVSNSGWTASTGSDLYAMLDEVMPSDADYISTSTLGAVCSLGLNATQYPGTASQTIQLRASSSTGNNLSVTIKDGATTIATRSLTLSPAFDLHTITLSAGEIALISTGALTVELTSI